MTTVFGIYMLTTPSILDFWAITHLAINFDQENMEKNIYKYKNFSMV
jgi:hypothetical protein